MNNLEFSQQLEKRLLEYSLKIARLCHKLEKNAINRAYIDQVVRSGSSIGANYIEANESLGRKDFYHKIRICRKESKETIYWLELLYTLNPVYKSEIELVKSEGVEYLKIFSKIANKLTN